MFQVNGYGQTVILLQFFWLKHPQKQFSYAELLSPNLFYFLNLFFAHSLFLGNKKISFLNYNCLAQSIPLSSLKGFYLNFSFTFFKILRYETIFSVFSILFAESYPFKWQEKGQSRIMLSVVWSMVSMFVAFIYLCNLRSHLIKKMEEVPPKSIEDFILPQYSYKLHVWYQFQSLDFVKILTSQGRFVPIKGRLPVNSECLNSH